ncbi:IS701 family transposase [Streptomyces sp. NPDC001404]|uniref:IS701 family transposase n=1 Tax=Streptomyces sp. NPDC001404 TaxID=3364571 RepID=UPI0036CC96E6
MSETELRLEDFAAEVFEPFGRMDQRRCGLAYLRGLLLDGGRKSVKAMAARLDGEMNRQALAHFVTSSPWDPAHVLAQVSWKIKPFITTPALVIDDAVFPKDGDASVCVAPQYTSSSRKITNCQVGVSLSLASDRARSTVNWRLFVPESWDPAFPAADPARIRRRVECGVPDGVGHVEKWQLALDMIDEVSSWNLRPSLVMADAEYGDSAAFRQNLQMRGLRYMVGISDTMAAHPADARLYPIVHGCRPEQLPPGGEEPISVEKLIATVRRAVKGAAVWHQCTPTHADERLRRQSATFAALRVRPAGPNHEPARHTCWLLVEWPAKRSEPTRFWLSDLATGRPLHSLVELAYLRRRTKDCHREMRDDLGLTHFEGRTWRGWHHHVALVSAAHAFETLQRLSVADSLPSDSAPRQPAKQSEESAPHSHCGHHNIPTHPTT